MNSAQSMVIDALQLGAKRAVEIHGAMALRGWKHPIEDLYVELVALEAREHVRVEGIYDGAGNRLAGAWALGRKGVPEPEPGRRIVNDMLDALSRPSNPDGTPSGVLIHRCL
jgi:hypothetical protein